MKVVCNKAVYIYVLTGALAWLAAAGAQGAAAPVSTPAPAATKEAAVAIPALEPAELDAALRSGTWQVVEFGGENCIPCRAMQPILQQVQTAVGKVGEVHNFWVQKNIEASRRFKIMVMPTQVIFNPKGEEVYRHEGYLEKDVFFTVLEGLGVI